MVNPIGQAWTLEKLIMTFDERLYSEGGLNLGPKGSTKMKKARKGTECAQPSW